MSFKSYISVDIQTPDNFYEYPQEEFEKYVLDVQLAQKNAEDAYIKALKKALKGKKYDFSVESK